MGVEVPAADTYGGLNLTRLKLDQAYVNITSNGFVNGITSFVYLRNEDCVGCPFKLEEKVRKKVADAAYFGF